eukprot:Clim_evm13s235 gene=Clim_evmTU13s235
MAPQVGYIHPDEFFQGPQVVWNWITKSNQCSTWEWDWDHETNTGPYRSFVSAAFATGPGYYAYQSIHCQDDQIYACMQSLSPYWRLVLPRLWMLALGLIVDLMLYRIGARSKKAWAPVLWNALSLGAITVGTHSFTNGIEMVIVALAFAMVDVLMSKPSHPFIPLLWRSVALGALLALGFFVRPTVLAFAIPMILLLLWHFGTRPDQLLVLCVNAAVAFAYVSFICLVIDTWYYHGKMGTETEGYRLPVTTTLRELKALLTGMPNKLFLTPFNLIAYNGDEANLEQHGLHPRWLHAVVNGPMLFGPIYFALAMWVAFDSFVRNRSTQTTARRAVFCLILSVAILSLSPHQEPRYLLGAQALVGSSLLALDNLPVWVAGVSTVINIGLILFFDGLHHSGVVMSMLSSDAPRQGCAVYVRTMGPPCFLGSTKILEHRRPVADLPWKLAQYRCVAEDLTVFHPSWIRWTDEDAGLKKTEVVQVYEGHVDTDHIAESMAIEPPPSGFLLIQRKFAKEGQEAGA